jgi:glycosyltransferase involved in cell wall biosynthesis
MTRLIVVSFPCCEPIRQDFYARVQRSTGWDVTIVLPARWRSEHGMREAQRWPGFTGELVKLHVLMNGNIPLHFYADGLTRILQRHRPDAVYVHHEAYGLATLQVVAANRRSVMAPLGFYSAQNVLKRYPWPFAASERYVHEHAGFACPISQDAATVLREKGYRGRIEVLPLGVDTDVFQPVARGVPPPNPPFKGEGELVVGCMARLVPEKGVDTLLEALARPAARGIRAVIAGDGPLAPRLKAQAAELGLNGRVSWQGYVPHHLAPDFYRHLDLLVVPSRTMPAAREQFGRVVVASDCGELPALLATTGGGWVFPEGDPDALTDILTRVRAGGLSELGLQGRERVRELYGVDRLAQRFAEVVDAAAGGRS